MTPLNASFDEDRAPVTCRMARQWHAIFPQHRLRHLESCPSCQSYLEAMHAQEMSLRHGAFERRDEVGATDRLERDILRAIRVAGPASSQARSRSRYRAWTLGGLGALAAIVVLMAGLRREPVLEQEQPGVGGTPVASAPVTAAPEVAVLIETVDSLSTEFVETVLPNASGLVANNPLQQELTSVYSDVRSALDFLALNFLPTTPTSEKAPPSRQI